MNFWLVQRKSVVLRSLEFYVKLAKNAILLIQLRKKATTNRDKYSVSSANGIARDSLQFFYFVWKFVETNEFGAKDTVEKAASAHRKHRKHSRSNERMKKKSQ